MKYFAGALLAAVSSFSVCSACSQSKIEIGVSAPFTGEGAVFGEDIRGVLTFAQKFYGDTNINFNFQDDQCAGRNGAAVAQYFVQQRVHAVLGYACVEAIMPAISILERQKIPVISLLASGSKITGEGKNVFNLYPSDELGVAVLIQRLKELHLQDVLVLTASSDFPVGITDAFKKQIAGSKDFRATFADYPPMTADFLSLLTRLNRRSFQAIFINYSSESEFIAFMRQLHQLHENVRVFTSYLNGFDAMKAEGAADLANGVEFYDTDKIDKILDQKQKPIFDRYVKQNGRLKSADGYFPFIFNGYVALRTALSEHGGIAETLLHRPFFDGLGGNFRFDNGGNVIGGPSFVMKKVVDGKIVAASK